jgi:CRP-like cAMP-binding protein
MGDLQSGGVPLSSFLKFCEGLPPLELNSGQVLLSEGSDTAVLYVLLSGEVEILKGDFRIDSVSQPGSIFGEVSLLLHIPHTATVRTTVPSHVFKIENATDVLSRHPELVREIARVLAYRLNRTTNFLVDLKQHFRGLTGALIGLALEEELPPTTIDSIWRRFTPMSEGSLKSES